ncbi:YXWGXW repeat-containing protein [Paraburkholderia dinghuensis]|uniref:Uncharacterized protein n=1 Tax=Paraburkholderia dinghuensis TaxID=2305225 RepID=A0A3N6NLC5_9BURK|nr:hypothetical protein D1Y85_01150 [Paraburkholderia dinghuensis]
MLTTTVFVPACTPAIGSPVFADPVDVKPAAPPARRARHGGFIPARGYWKLAHGHYVWVAGRWQRGVEVRCLVVGSRTARGPSWHRPDSQQVSGKRQPLGASFACGLSGSLCLSGSGMSGTAVARKG